MSLRISFSLVERCTAAQFEGDGFGRLLHPCANEETSNDWSRNGIRGVMRQTFTGMVDASVPPKK